MAEDGLLLWLDLEMTGLDPSCERIIEIASIVTNDMLEVVEVGPNIVIHQPEELLQAMDRWNKNHHRASGLIIDVQKSKVDTTEAEDITLDFVKRFCAKHKIPLAGNSIHMDRVFLRLYMPRLLKWMHYRIIDVSSIKELVRRWYPDIYCQRPSKKGIHRAQADIFESIEELKFYRSRAFLPTHVE